MHLKALNLMKLVASYHACAKDIVNSMTLLLTYCTVPVGRRNTGQVKVTLQVITKSIKTSKKLSSRTAPNISTVVGLIESWHKYDKVGFPNDFRLFFDRLTHSSLDLIGQECEQFKTCSRNTVGDCYR